MIPEDQRSLALKLVTLRHIQAQRGITDRTLERKLGIANGAMVRFYAGDPGYSYLADRVDRALGQLSRKGRYMASDVRAQRDLEAFRRSGEWRDANWFIDTVEAARGGWRHQQVMLEQIMQERPFFGEDE